jgi:hypothetical protein
MFVPIRTERLQDAKCVCGIGRWIEDRRAGGDVFDGISENVRDDQGQHQFRMAVTRQSTTFDLAQASPYFIELFDGRAEGG